MSPSSNIISLSDISLEQAITNIIESIALEENALSEILNSESEIVLKTNKISNNIDDFKAVNESVNNVIKSVLRLQMKLQFELDDTELILQNSGEYYENDDLEE